MLVAAPALVNHGALFARVIVALLSQAQGPQLKHLWVFANDKPRTEQERWKCKDRYPLEPSEKDRHCNEHDGHPR